MNYFIFNNPYLKLSEVILSVYIITTDSQKGTCRRETHLRQMWSPKSGLHEEHLGYDISFLRLFPSIQVKKLTH